MTIVFLDRDKIRRSNNVTLESWGVLVNEYLPCYYSIDELKPPNASDVAIRSLILTYVLGVTANVPTERLMATITELGINGFLFESEATLLRTQNPTEEQIDKADWTFEYLLSIAWALGRENIDPFITDHVKPSRENADLLDFYPRPFSDPNDFVENASLREFSELYKTADLYYRLHWACVENRLRPHGCRLVQPVIVHRRRALDWIIGVDANWDEISLDT